MAEINNVIRLTSDTRGAKQAEDAINRVIRVTRENGNVVRAVATTTSTSWNQGTKIIEKNNEVIKKSTGLHKALTGQVLTMVKAYLGLYSAQRIIQAIINGVKELFRVSAVFEKTEIFLRSIGQTASVAKAQLKSLVDFSASSVLQLEEIVRLVPQIQAQGIFDIRTTGGFQASLKFMEQAGAIAKASGKDIEQMIRAIGQAGKGIFIGRQLTTALLDPAQLKKDINSGLSAAEAAIKQWTGKFGTLGAAMADSLAVKLSNLPDMMSKMWLKLSDAGQRAFKRLIDWILENFERFIDYLDKNKGIIARFFDNAIDRVIAFGNALKKIFGWLQKNQSWLMPLGISIAAGRGIGRSIGGVTSGQLAGAVGAETAGDYWLRQRQTGSIISQYNVAELTRLQGEKDRILKSLKFNEALEKSGGAMRGYAASGAVHPAEVEAASRILKNQIVEQRRQLEAVNDSIFNLSGNLGKARVATKSWGDILTSSISKTNGLGTALKAFFTGVAFQVGVLVAIGATAVILFKKYADDLARIKRETEDLYKENTQNLKLLYAARKDTKTKIEEIYRADPELYKRIVTGLGKAVATVVTESMTPGPQSPRISLKGGLEVPERKSVTTTYTVPGANVTLPTGEVVDQRELQRRISEAEKGKMFGFATLTKAEKETFETLKKQYMDAYVQGVRDAGEQLTPARLKQFSKDAADAAASEMAKMVDLADEFNANASILSEATGLLGKNITRLEGTVVKYDNVCAAFVSQVLVNQKLLDKVYTWVPDLYKAILNVRGSTAIPSFAEAQAGDIGFKVDKNGNLTHALILKEKTGKGFVSIEEGGENAPIMTKPWASGENFKWVRVAGEGIAGAIIKAISVPTFWESLSRGYGASKEKLKMYQKFGLIEPKDVLKERFDNSKDYLKTTVDTQLSLEQQRKEAEWKLEKQKELGDTAENIKTTEDEIATINIQITDAKKAQRQALEEFERLQRMVLRNSEKEKQLEIDKQILMDERNKLMAGWDVLFAPNTAEDLLKLQLMFGVSGSKEFLEGMIGAKTSRIDELLNAYSTSTDENQKQELLDEINREIEARKSLNKELEEENKKTFPKTGGAWGSFGKALRGRTWDPETGKWGPATIDANDYLRTAGLNAFSTLAQGGTGREAIFSGLGAAAGMVPGPWGVALSGVLSFAARWFKKKEPITPDVVQRVYVVNPEEIAGEFLRQTQVARMRTSGEGMDVFRSNIRLGMAGVGV